MSLIKSKLIQNITDQSGMVYAGMGPDFRVLVRKARKNAQAYYRVYHEHQPMNQVVSDTADLMQECTQAGGVRPFGVSVLTCGYDDKGPQLYQIDPSGICLEWKATAIGKNFVNAKTFLEKRYNEAKDYLQLAVSIIPSDPVINDHYGDSLWMNNQSLQARYYWKYVLNLEKTEPELKELIKKKLTNGLKFDS